MKNSDIVPLNLQSMVKKIVKNRQYVKNQIEWE